jgi:DNA-directed RNA polymerase subunit RPC12/RpoP
MERRVFHGSITPADVAQALLAEFNRGNLRAQAMGESDRMVVQVATRPGAPSGGDTALTISVERCDDGVMAEIGQQAWFGVAASLGTTALWALRNPLSLLGRLDDVAQDIENLQLSERVWQVIAARARTAGASAALSERLRRVACEYCGTANPTGEPSCIACGAPLGKAQPGTCPQCGFVVKAGEAACPNCGRKL